MSVQSFWNETRGVYELSLDGERIAETTDTKTSMRFCSAYSEIGIAQRHLDMVTQHFIDLRLAHPVQDTGESP